VSFGVHARRLSPKGRNRLRLYSRTKCVGRSCDLQVKVKAKMKLNDSLNFALVRLKVIKWRRAGV
jgi:hypothetical protein